MYVTFITYHRHSSHPKKKIEKWSSYWGFSLSKEKTVGVVFCHHLKKNKTEILINGTQIKFVDQVSFLGMTLDRHLTWRPHIQRITDKCKKILNLMRAISGQTWGSAKSNLLTIYKTLIRSRLGLRMYSLQYHVQRPEERPWQNTDGGTQDLQRRYEEYTRLRLASRVRRDSIGPKKAEFESQICRQGQRHRQSPSCRSTSRKLAMPESNSRKESVHENFKSPNQGSSDRSGKNQYKPDTTLADGNSSGKHRLTSQNQQVRR